MLIDVRGSTSSYNSETLNFLISELQFKDIESGIRNKLNGLLAELKAFKFVNTLVLEFKKQKVMMK